MNISVFGLGYVGVVTIAYLTSRNHNVVGVDVNSLKVKMLNEGICPIVEKDVPEMLKDAKDKGLISATVDAAEAIGKTELSIICVGTPSEPNGNLDTKYLKNACEEAGKSIRDKVSPHIFVFRSTMLPGTMRNIVIPILESSSGKKQNEGFYVVFNPEFLRESTAVFDFYNPPKTVVGSDSEEIAQKVLSLYEGLPGPMIKTKIEVAEMVKYVDNNFHALKITFANEIGHICKSIGLDSHEVMNIFMKDTKLNISTYYLKPGFAFGGSCLPKDLRAINYLARTLDLELPLLSSLLPSNHNQIQSAIKRIISQGKNKIGIAGFSFKEGTDDLRESPMIDIIEALIGKGYDLKLYDRNVYVAKLVGANKDYIEKHIPHISALMVDSLDEILEDRELIIIGNKDPEFIRIIEEARDDQMIFDLVRMGDKVYERANYEGICW
ncbi:nucleotide sugar dehydrogenase [Pseudobacteroides cellulosolvens]|uniref:UDP-glucose 6-dehydrogenase n=1 Tax=Pseudobacteroides cellulosolvens ATCC 35603 = DSM 2933 TaxID=398512 RepID=A0A0L6JLD3_9FIRM|nr:nucleotide sugar dehydrogenase [Pseudobacteroides cellulosolvens]KNY26584.1 nucleotide sugar dehydrogenase [Pseudobacteroides cellulosolvens ATCC 35603 = DSM 2933]